MVKTAKNRTVSSATIGYGFHTNWVGGLAWFVLLPCFRWALYRYFPSLSHFLGYGRVDDQLPRRIVAARDAVRFYSFFSCPFCPIVLQRLGALQKEMGFNLEKIDVTLHLQLAKSKSIRSVPVVEVGDRRLVGNATSEQLGAFVGMTHNTEPSRSTPMPPPGGHHEVLGVYRHQR